MDAKEDATAQGDEPAAERPEDVQRRQRLLRNRFHAAASRQRKSEAVQRMRKALEDLEPEHRRLVQEQCVLAHQLRYMQPSPAFIAEVTALQSENLVLRQQIFELVIRPTTPGGSTHDRQRAAQRLMTRVLAPDVTAVDVASMPAVPAFVDHQPFRVPGIAPHPQPHPQTQAQVRVPSPESPGTAGQAAAGPAGAAVGAQMAMHGLGFSDFRIDGNFPGDRT